jgi:hypothetical protein
VANVATEAFTVIPYVVQVLAGEVAPSLLDQKACSMSRLCIQLMLTL